MRTIRTQRFVRGSQNGGGTTTPGGNTTIGLAPFVSEVCGAKIPVKGRNKVQIKGYHFTSNVTVDTGDSTSGGQFVNNDLFPVRIRDVEFINPTLLEATVYAGDFSGKYDLIVRNGGLHSGDTGKEAIEIADPVWVDLRKVNLPDLGMVLSDGITLNPNRMYGLSATAMEYGDGESFDKVVKFGAFPWKRCDGLSFSMVFTLTGLEGTNLFGIGGQAVNVNNLGPVPLFEAESHLFLINGTTNQMYGGGSRYRRWTKDLETIVSFETGKFYKLNYHYRVDRTLMTLSEVNPSNFDATITPLHQWLLDSPSDSEMLVPYWTVGSNPNFYLTAFKIGG